MGDYWHGSPVVLEVGTTLTSLRSRRGAAMDATQYGYLSDNLHDPDRVYFTTDAELARAWCVRSEGALLRVEPTGEVQPDPDFPGTSFSAVQARVVEVAKHPVKMSQMAARRAFAAYDPDSFDAKGFIHAGRRLPEMLAASGGNETPFRKAGRYPNPQRFVFRAGRLMYLTDDLELIVTEKLIREQGGVAEPLFERCLAEARSRWPAMQPIPWI